MSREAAFWPRPNSFPVRSCVTYFDLAQTPSQRATSRSPFSSPCRGKTRSIASKFASNSSFAARRKQRRWAEITFTSLRQTADFFCTIQRNAEQTEGKPLFFFFLEAENCLGNTRGSNAPSWRTSLETTTGTPLQSRSSTPTTNMNSSLCESRTTSTTWRRTRAPDL